VPVDFSGWCFGWVVWVGGTLWVFAAAARGARAAGPGKAPPPCLS
jgi:hypothetical protein